MDWFISLLTLAALEVVLGVDNLIFLSIQANKLPIAERPLARKLGLGIALMARLGLLAAISWIAGLVEPLITVLGHTMTGRDLVLGGGGLFLLGKAAHEIHDALEAESCDSHASNRGKFWSVVFQIGLMDIVFSLDSVITAVGIGKNLAVMMMAVTLAMVVMVFCAGVVGDFVHRHPSMKILALSFLLLVGATLIAEAAGQHVSRGTTYFAMGFSFMVEIVNMRIREQPAAPVELRGQAKDGGQH